ncbi:MAG: spore coat protein CotJB [Ruminococcus sp.]
MTEREILMKKLASYQFIIYDLKLYLDTHPNDKATIAKIEELTEKLTPIRKDFEDRYGPLFAENNNKNKWKWIKSPWPWETEEDD